GVVQPLPAPGRTLRVTRRNSPSLPFTRPCSRQPGLPRVGVWIDTLNVPKPSLLRPGLLASLLELLGEILERLGHVDAIGGPLLARVLEEFPVEAFVGSGLLTPHGEGAFALVPADFEHNKLTFGPVLHLHDEGVAVGLLDLGDPRRLRKRLHHERNDAG